MTSFGEICDRKCTLIAVLIFGTTIKFFQFFHDFDKKQAFFWFSHSKKRPFLAPGRVFFAADSGNAKTNAVRRCVMAQSEIATRQKATQKKATTVLRYLILGNF